HLVDATPRLVEEAQKQSSLSSRPLASCQIGDARELSFADESVQIVLLLGPLYHLTTATDRNRALSEARRVLSPGGYLFAAGISRWASALDGLAREFFKDPDFLQIVDEDVCSGQHRNPTGRLDYFTTSYFHRPEELREEALAAGFLVQGLYGIE